MDGGCFEHIEPLLRRSLLPNFKMILDNGFYAKLKVTTPPATIPSWPCSFSGLDPEQLGFFYFIHPEKGLFNSNEWRERSIFSLKDLRMFVLNVPGTYPAWKINGEMITGMMSPSISCYPFELKAKYEKDWIISGNNIEEIFQAFKMKSSLFLKKLEESFDLMIYVIKAPDSISHQAPGNINKALSAIYRSYIRMDKFLGKILNNFKIENLIIFSDHGLKVYKNEYNIQRYFEKKGLLVIDDPKLKRTYRTIFKLIDFVRPFIKSNPLSNFYRRYRKSRSKRKKSVKKTDIVTKDRSRTQYYTANVGGLFLKGQDKHKLERIKKDLQKNKNIKKIISPNINGFPDLFIILEDKFLFSKDAAFYLKRKRETISHKDIGFFMAFGRDIIKGKVDFVDFQNIAPTIMKMLKKEKPNYMKGNPLDIFKSYIE
ncbi:MAG: alkaline phosphatase family protein [Promethearchaeota archaeon]